MTPPVFETQSLSHSYGKVRAVIDLSLKVEEGQIFGILGPNGSGKTTTLSIATGILSQDKGECLWFNQPPTSDSRKMIGSLIEVPHFFTYLDLVQNLKLIARIKNFGADDIPRVLKLVKLWDRRRSKFRTLSLGMKQRLAIAACLLGDPRVLVLDEPTNGLDPEGIAEVRELIMEEAGRGKTIIMASHILSEVEKVCSHVAIFKKGRLIEQGDVRTLLGGEIIIELEAEDLSKLTGILEDCPLLNWVKKENGFLTAGLREGETASRLNQYVFEKGISLSRLITHKKSLESQFLELVKD